jgi:hypothetical protein
MPAFLLTTDAAIQCAHGAQAKALSAQPRVKVAGAPVVTLASPYQVTGCANPPSAGSPCQTGQFTSAAGRVKSAGQPLLLQGSQSMSVPTGAPLVVVNAQQRVKGS